jgi:hypothetical protein
MSEHIQKAVENLDSVIEQVTDESIKSRILKVQKILSQNRKKIWLRTKSGKPMAEETLSLTNKLVNKFEDTVLVELESQAEKIEEESRRRSMVVT